MTIEVLMSLRKKKNGKQELIYDLSSKQSAVYFWPHPARLHCWSGSRSHLWNFCLGIFEETGATSARKIRLKMS